MTSERGELSASVSSGCPVKHNDTNNSPPVAATWSFWGSLFSNDSKSTVNASSDSTCPVKDAENVPPIASIEEAARHAQTPQSDQRIFLDTARQVSSISRGNVSASNTPSHQSHVGLVEESTDQKWVYPSEQQMYNAMRKKGWSNIPEDSIPTVLQIHNNINERTWRQIQDWEGTDALNLVSFQGRPRDVTPKAFFLCYLLRLYDPPFDRHDWFVAREGSTNAVRQPLSSSSPQRYVIDYYYLPPEHPSQPPIPYVDARPALDHPRAVWLHSRRFLQFAFPGITTYLQRQSQK